MHVHTSVASSSSSAQAKTVCINGGTWIGSIYLGAVMARVEHATYDSISKHIPTPITQSSSQQQVVNTAVAYLLLWLFQVLS